MSSFECLALSLGILAVGAAVQAFELLFVPESGRWRFTPEFATSARWARMRGLMVKVETPHLTVVLVALRPLLIAASCGLAIAAPQWMAVTIWPALGLTAWRNLRFAELSHGSATMELILLVPAAIWSLDPSNEVLSWICLASVAAQLGLAYFGAGLTKLKSAAWRRGEGLTYILDGSPGVTMAICWMVIAFELLFPFSLFGGPWVSLGFLAGGLLFHAMIAILMGPHAFLWSFSAAYPAFWFVAARLSCWMGLS